MSGNELCTSLQLSCTRQILGHFASISLLPVPDQLVGALHHLITGLLQGVPSQSHVLENMTIHDMHLET